jgi:dolichol-phosphate mannosyltransferase
MSARESERSNPVLLDGKDWASPRGVDISVVVPTYCEADNLRVLIPRLAECLDKLLFSWEVIIVDDDSPDATISICNALSANFPVRLLVRSRDRGLSTAVLLGMHQAIGEILIVMDADLSHPPEKVPELVYAIKEGADFVVGSRYVGGSSTDKDWGILRWINSRAATWLAWPISKTTDPMSGFFAIRKEQFVVAKDLRPIGYKIALELQVKCNCKNVLDVPIRFSNRLHGMSKLSLREQVNYLRHLKRLYVFKCNALLRELSRRMFLR